MDITIREAVVGDAQAICDLMNRELDLGLNVDLAIIASQMERMLLSGDYRICVAIDGQRVAGFVAAHKAMILEMTNEYVRIIGLAVVRQYRGHGLGRMLVESVAGWAKKVGAAYIALNSTLLGTKDHEFYEAVGFVKKSFGFSRVIV